MFLMRLIYLSGLKPKNSEKKDILSNNINNKEDRIETSSNLKKENIINQIKNITQEKKIKPSPKSSTSEINQIKVTSLNDLLNICNMKKEMKLKYELENNVNLVKFDQERIEIAFNDNLDKSFVKDLSSKLFDWTGKRWIISFSQVKGEITIKQKEINKKNELIEKLKKSETYRDIKKYFVDAELNDVQPIKKDKIEKK